MINFMMTFGTLVVELHRLLGMRFIKGNISDNSQVGQSLQRIVDFNNTGNYYQRDHELIKMTLLVKHLKEIERYDLDLLKIFKKQLYKCDARDKYFGVRFEINIAASLIRKNVIFTKDESPDFRVHKGDGQIFVECGSAHLSKPKPGDVKYKICSVINKKSRKPYCNPVTALFIDITNIIYNNLINAILPEKSEIKEHIKETLFSIPFGAVILFTYIHNKELNRFESVYIRIDNECIDKTLLNFLNEFYPLDEHKIHRYAVPSDS